MTTANEEIQRLRTALDRAAYALFQAKRLVDSGPITREHVATAHAAACKVLDAEPPYVPPPDVDGSIQKDAARYRWLRDGKPNALHLTYNGDHASSYRTAKEWIEVDMPEWFKDEPAGALEAMKATNTIWALQVYPDTPVGFVHANRATLDELIDLAMADGGFEPSPSNSERQDK